MLCLCQGRPNNITIEYLCGFMTNTSLGTSLERFVQLNKALFRGAPNNADYDGMVRSMNATSWNSGTAKAGGGCGGCGHGYKGGMGEWCKSAFSVASQICFLATTGKPPAAVSGV